MDIILKEEQGLTSILTTEGYSQAEILEVRETIRNVFDHAAHLVFSEILDRPLPETITVYLEQSDKEEHNDKKSSSLAFVHSRISTEKALLFSIHETMVRDMLAHREEVLLDRVAVHEMLHAADLPVLQSNYALIQDLRQEILDSIAAQGHKTEKDPRVSLFAMLRILHHYRSEGVAVLGESLLFKLKEKQTDTAYFTFVRNFLQAADKAVKWIRKQNFKEAIFDQKLFEAAYYEGPCVVLWALVKKEAITIEMMKKAMKGMSTGEYDLTDAEVKDIIRAALSLRLSDFVQSMLHFGGPVVEPLFAFCSILQNEDEQHEKVEAFIELMQQPDKLVAFDTAMNQLVGNCIPDDKLDERYKAFCANPPDEASCPEMKEKVDRLYAIMKKDENSYNRKTARWTLNYIFFEEDLIYDDIKGLGFVDDMVLIDGALKIVGKNSNEENK